MKNKFKTTALIALTFGLLLNLQYAVKGYSNDGIAYAEGTESGSGSAATLWTESHGPCSLTISGTAGASYNIMGFTGKFNANGSATLTASNASTGCAAGGLSQCHYVNCNEFWANQH